ncbi:zinc finger protein 596-like [Agrilus planipennis]|uniref:Zinc finger protein 596-like n=1 Tax=Agrilus planipennis TaxID=224129 RepID=A0A7F5RBY0_AGRPL|nr:zinc finger protein 596-like [Agrilus planipennis]
MEYINIKQMCRICLNIKEEHEMFSVYNIAEKIMSFTTIEITKSDGLPGFICLKCYEVANIAYTFKQQCEKSEHLLKSDETILEKVNALKQQEGRLNVFKVKFQKQDIFSIILRENFIKPIKVSALKKNTCKDIHLKKNITVNDSFETSHDSDQYNGEDNDEFKDLTCRFCNFKANTWKVRYKHEITHGKGIDCYLCGKEFTSLRTMTNHLLHHKRKGAFPCLTCGKKFTLQENLSKHMKRHLGIRPYSCAICNKSFTERSELRIHLASHSQEKRFLCNMCGNKYSRKRLLTMHIEKHHPEPGKALLLCTLCGKGYKDLRLHMLFHKNERKYVCKVCSKAFNSRSNLKTHENIHAEKRPYTCHLCPKGFNQKHVLRTHLKKHHQQSDN